MQTPASTPAKAPAAQIPAATTPPPAPFVAGQATPIAVLQEQVASLSQQLAGLRAQRSILQRQINRASDGTVRAALELKQVPIENQIAQVEVDLASARAQLASRQGTTEQQQFVFPPGAGRRQMDPDLVIGVFMAFIFAVLMPMSIAMARRIWRSSAKAVAPRTDDIVVPRLDRLEQAVDAIAIEIERISEGQRFVTRVLAERPMTASAQPHAGQNQKDVVGNDGKPILALGAGPAEQIRAAERQAVRQSITPH